KPDNDPSMVGGAGGASPEEVAAAVLACVGDDRYVAYATERDDKTSAAKAADPNAFLAKAQQALSALL
ncbi:MAG: hypothetical protein JWN96_528, partial [Mycobacterium sp.]|nr:hypothetical protein [Mycobacterium sp.]